MVELLYNVRKYSHKELLKSTVLSINTDRIEFLKKEIQLLQKRGETELFTQKNIDTIDKLGLALFFNVVNFCFMDPESKQEYKYISKNQDLIPRSTGLFRAMQESDVKWRDFKDVARLTNTKWITFTQINQENPLYLGPERHNRIIKFANYLIDKGYRNPTQLLEEQHFNVKNILQILVGSKLFEDKFLKRAQVAVKGIAEAIAQDNITLQGIDELTCMPDYRLPQVFYNLNIINLDPKVLNSLLKLEILEPNGDVEISLRASVVVIGETLSKLMNKPEFQVDSLLWRLSQKLSEQGKLKIPHMIVATDKY